VEEPIEEELPKAVEKSEEADVFAGEKFDDLPVNDKLK